MIHPLGREVRTEKVKEIYRMFQEHGFRLAGLRSLGRHLTADDLTEKRQRAAARLGELPAISKGVRAGS